MKLNSAIRDDMAEAVVKDAFASKFETVNRQIQSLAKFLINTKFESHVEGYTSVLTQAQCKEGFQQSLQYKVALTSTKPNGTVYNFAYLAPVAFRRPPKDRKDRKGPVIVGEPMNARPSYGSDCPDMHLWNEAILTTPHMQRDSVVSMPVEGEFTEKDGIKVSHRNLMLDVMADGKRLQQEALEFYNEIRDALQSCNSDKQVRNMMPMMAKYLPQPVNKAVVPVESLEKVNQIIKQQLGAK